MTFSKVTRGHEGREHIGLKLAVAAQLVEAGYDAIFFEHHLCDLVAVRIRGSARQILGVEVERSARNVGRNVHRDIEAGCDRVLVVCPSDRVATAVRRKLQRTIEPALLKRVSIVTPDEVVERIKGVDSGLFGVPSGCFRPRTA